MTTTETDSRFGDPRLPKRFWDKATVDQETGCWIWRASRTERGCPRPGWRWCRACIGHAAALVGLAGEVVAMVAKADQP